MSTMRRSRSLTFIVGPDGTVYQKGIGPETQATAIAMTRYDPDSTWTG